jgi:dipeptide/tripeptide permease
MLTFIYLTITETIIFYGVQIPIFLDIILYLFSTLSELFGLVYGLHYCLSYSPKRRKVAVNSFYFLTGFFGNVIGGIVASQFDYIDMNYFLVFLAISLTGYILLQLTDKKSIAVANKSFEKDDTIQQVYESITTTDDHFYRNFL